MPFARFTFNLQGTPKNLEFDPADLSQFNPYGQRVRAADGAMLYMGAGTTRLLFPVLKLKGLADGSDPAHVAGTATELMQAYQWAINNADGLMTFSFWDPRTGSSEEIQARIERPDIAVALGGGNVLRDFELVLHGISVTSGTYAGGAPFTPPAAAPVFPGASGLGSGAFGANRFGYGTFGHGE